MVCGCGRYERYGGHQQSRDRGGSVRDSAWGEYGGGGVHREGSGGAHGVRGVEMDGRDGGDVLGLALDLRDEAGVGDVGVDCGVGDGDGQTAVDFVNYDRKDRAR